MKDQPPLLWLRLNPKLVRREIEVLSKALTKEERLKIKENEQQLKEEREEAR